MKTRIATTTAWFILVFGAAGSANANLIMNGGFEDPDIPSNTWSVHVAIPGWTSSGPGIEIQNNVAGAPFEGDQFVELDSHGGTDTNSGMKQSVTTASGGSYTLSFAYSARPNVPSTSNGIQVFWGGVSLGVITADGTNNADTDWMIQTFNVMGTGSMTDLEFVATGTDDSLGGYLDDVRLSAIPEPSTLALLGAGLLGLGLTRRRRTR